MSNIRKIIQKMLLKEPFYEGGFEYQFISVEPEEDWAIKFTVKIFLRC